jgi:hypothetical protein
MHADPPICSLDELELCVAITAHNGFISVPSRAGTTPAPADAPGVLTSGRGSIVATGQQISHDDALVEQVGRAGAAAVPCRSRVASRRSVRRLPR